MEFLSQNEFLKKNDLIANKLVSKILVVCTLPGPIIALGKWFNLFETEYIFCFGMWVIGMIEYAILLFMGCDERNYIKAKYFGLIAIEILIGLVATDRSIGIHMTYGFIPLLSCIYIDEKLTRRICIFSYVVMIVSLYFKSFGMVIYDYPRLTPFKWFITQSMGYTIEFLCFSIATSCMAHYARKILQDSYQLGKERFYFEEAGKVKNAFLVNLSEEIRSPLEEVGKASEMLLKQDSMSKEMRDKIVQINKKNEMLHTFLDDIDDFAKLQLDKIEIVEEEYCLSELIKDIGETMLSRIGDKNIDLNVVVNPLIPNHLYGDRLRIRQILINLLNNTVKYMEDGFIILRVDWKRKKELAILNIEVMDTGCGIEEKDIFQVLESFSKQEINVKEHMEGISLGLPICMRLCEMMNGKMTIREGYGRGSLFTISLPQKIVNK